MACAHAFLAGRQQVGGEQPLVQWNFATFKERADGDGKLLATAIALIEPDAVRFARKLSDRFGFATMRTVWAIRPDTRFQPLTGLGACWRSKCLLSSLRNG